MSEGVARCIAFDKLNSVQMDEPTKLTATRLSKFCLLFIMNLYV